VSFRPEISVVVPLYIRAEVVGHFTNQLITALRTIETTWEIELVDDGSRDETARRIREIAAHEPGIVPVELSQLREGERAITRCSSQVSGIHGCLWVECS
jgi:glycosyltransferase involved in cell wall biosynthesis